MPVQPEEVLDFWFGAPGTSDYGRSRELWFRKSQSTDEAIRAGFAATVEAALRGELQDWRERDARSALALILLLDQFTRNLYRDTAQAFAGDAMALSAARSLVASGRDAALIPVECWFAYMPFEHSEAMADQHESLRLFRRLAVEGLESPLEWAQKHFDVIARFGRYPHRNELLGRASTAEEIEFLRQPGSRF